jgi:signal peptidase II
LRKKLVIFAAVFPTVMVLDWVTKRWALEALSGGRRLETLGGLVPLTLAYNKGAAFGLNVGPDSRWLFVPITFVALVLLATLYRQARQGDLLRLISLALVISGAIGNLYDRVRWSRGVIDFIGPIDLGFADFPIFNVADVSISCGAVLLAGSFWLEERNLQQDAQPTPPQGSPVQIQDGEGASG